MATALLVIDVQVELVEALDADRRRELFGVLVPLIARARAAGIPVVYVRHEDELLVPGTRLWEIAAEVAPRAGEPIVEKRHRDAFRETTLAAELARLNVDHLVVCGMQSEFCVDATIREAERSGYRVTLVADGHATYAAEGASEQAIHAQVHRVARDAVAAIVSADDLFAATGANS